MSNSGQSFKTTAATFGRQPEELHIPPATTSSTNLARGTRDSYPDVGQFLPPATTTNMHPLSPYVSGHRNTNSLSSSNLPGALQPGNRPHAISTNTAPSLIPTVPQLSVQTQHQQPPPPPPPINLHNHSRSSPGAGAAGFEQPPRYKYNMSSRGSALSPLGLADIRPSSDVAMSPRHDEQVPTNSNYVAPWPIYAVDWCKWPAHHHGGTGGGFGGKVAFGSYLEDSHNYVCPPVHRTDLSSDLTKSN